MIYLDNSATTKQAPAVTEKMLECMERDFGNPSSLHHGGLQAEKLMKEARRNVLDAMAKGEGGRSSGAGGSGIASGELVFTSGGTEADNMAIFGIAKAMKRRGHRIVTTAVEHPAVLECFRTLAEQGYEMVTIAVDREGNPDMAALEDAIDDKTILASVMQVNNEVGTVMPVDQVAEIIKKKGYPARLHCDAVQSFGKMPLPAFADLIAVSGHKIHGPKGSGALWVREGVNVPAHIYGGGQEKGLRSGTENVPAIVGLGEAARIMAEEREEAFERVGRLRDRLLSGLMTEIEDVILNGPEKWGTEAGCASPYILNVSFPGTRGEVILHTLEQEGIYVSTGSACSSNKKGRSHVLEAMGLGDKEAEGAIRYSFSPETDPDEIDQTIAKTAEAVKRFRKLGSFR